MHEYTYAVTQEPTATEAGVLLGTCSKCGAVETIVLPELNQTDYTVTVVTAVSCVEAGLERGEGGKFKAKTPCTRGYVVTYLYRFITGQELVQ